MRQKKTKRRSQKEEVKNAKKEQNGDKKRRKRTFISKKDAIKLKKGQNMATKKNVKKD